MQGSRVQGSRVRGVRFWVRGVGFQDLGFQGVGFQGQGCRIPDQDLGLVVLAPFQLCRKPLYLCSFFNLQFSLRLRVEVSGYNYVGEEITH